MKLRLRANLPNLKVWAIKGGGCLVFEGTEKYACEETYAKVLIMRKTGTPVSLISAKY